MEELSRLKGEIIEKEKMAQEQARKEEQIEVGTPSLIKMSDSFLLQSSCYLFVHTGSTRRTVYPRK